MDVPTGRVQIIRGPTPEVCSMAEEFLAQSVRHPRSAATRTVGEKPVQSPPQRSIQQSPEQRSEVAKQKVLGIEADLAALAAAGSTEGPEVTMLKEALQRARR